MENVNNVKPPEDTPGDTASAASDEFDLAKFAGDVGNRKYQLQVYREADRQLDEETRPPIMLPPVTSLDNLLAEQIPDQQFIIDKLVPTEGRVLLSAPDKGGKTTLLDNLVHSLADKEPFLGHFTVHQAKAHIVIIDNELPRSTLQRWLRDAGIENTAAVADVISLRGQVGLFDLLDERCLSMWADRLADLGCDYLVFDCLRPVLDALGLDENRDAGKFLVRFDELLNRAGVPAALMVQHMGHANERARGDSRLLGWPDALWRIVRENPDDPMSTRFFSAYGRDVEVREGRLTFDEQTRRLVYAPGSRADAKTEAALKAVLAILAEDAKNGGGNKGLSGKAIEAAADTDHTRNAVRAAVKLALKRKFVITSPGAHGAKLHSIANPCAKCGMPLAVGQLGQHFSCVAQEWLADE